ncbi:hypothetical protein [Microbulbifer sp. JMSA003]|uniref:hypothetical protein n=1 Tax=Microbulbifer sp. JMSA003 TaxID=3243369 RepID=UPI004039B9C2
MTKVVFLVFSFSVALFARASENQPLWLQYSDQLVLKYHLSSMKHFPSVDDLVVDLKNSSPEFQTLVDGYKRERDAFKKKELSNAIAEKLYSTALPESNGKIAYFSRIYLSEYNFEKEGFDLCFNKNCDPRPAKVSEKFGARKYELLVSNVGTKIFISPEEEVAKKMEALAAKGTGWNYRLLPAVIVVEPNGTNDSKKWSDGTSYKVLETNLTGIYILNDENFNRKILPEDSEIATYLEYRK